MGDIDNSAPATPTPEHSGESTTSVASSSRRVPSVGRGFLGGVAAVCVATAVLSFVALSGGQKSSGVSDAAANSKLKAAAPAKAAAPKAAAAAPAAANAAAVQPQGAGPAAAPAAATSQSIMIMNYAFSPSSLTVAPGTTVTWTNMDTAPHTVTVTSGPVKFNSPNLQKGDTYSFTFTAAGTYKYYCAVHPDMTAAVTVTGGTSTPTPTPTPTTTEPTPTPTPTASSPPPPSETCAVSTALQTFLTHLNAAHLSESPAQQLQDILNFDKYIGMHMVLVENMLAPLTEGGLTSILSTDLTTFLMHINSAHLAESPAQQVQDILNVNQYLASHMVLIEHLLEPIEAAAC